MTLMQSSVAVGTQILSKNMSEVSYPMTMSCTLKSSNDLKANNASSSLKEKLNESRRSEDTANHSATIGSFKVTSNSYVNAYWSYWMQSVASRFDVLFTPVLFVAVLSRYPHYLNWNETRTDIKGFASLSDPVLEYITPHDFSIPLFFLAYGSIILAFCYGCDKPSLVLEFLQTKSLVILARIVGLYLTPLEAPEGTIPLVDPLVHGDGVTLVRDLFFSGHTATTFVVFFTCRSQNYRWKTLFFLMGATTATMVIFQKTHYVIDVYAAPFFVYSCHRLVVNSRKMFGILYQTPEVSLDHLKSQ